MSTDEMCMIYAGYNHSLALSCDGKVFSWGYNGYNLTGRKHSVDVNLSGLAMQILLDLRPNKPTIKYSHSVKVNDQIERN